MDFHELHETMVSMRLENIPIVEIAEWLKSTGANENGVEVSLNDKNEIVTTQSLVGLDY